jgi:competence protein ComEA
MRTPACRILQFLRSLFVSLNLQSVRRFSQSSRTFSCGQQIFLLFLFFLLAGLLVVRFSPSPFATLTQKTAEENAVEVTGHVRNPGVRLFDRAPTLKEAIERAGGLQEGELPDSPLSLERLETGTRVSVEKEPETIRIRLDRMEAPKLLVFSIPLDLNRVSEEDLCLIPGIGESLAREVIAHRERRKGFRSVDELRSVRGIGDKKWQELRGFFTVSEGKGR